MSLVLLKNPITQQCTWRIFYFFSIVNVNYKHQLLCFQSVARFQANNFLLCVVLVLFAVVHILYIIIQHTDTVMTGT